MDKYIPILSRFLNSATEFHITDIWNSVTSKHIFFFNLQTAQSFVLEVN